MLRPCCFSQLRRLIPHGLCGFIAPRYRPEVCLISCRLRNPERPYNRQSHKHIARPSKHFPRKWTDLHHCSMPKHTTLTAHRFPLVLGPPCCHVLPEPQGLHPKPSPLLITMLPLLSARYSLGLPRLMSFHSENTTPMTEITETMLRFKHRNA